MKLAPGSSSAATRLRSEDAVSTGVRSLRPDERSALSRRGHFAIVSGCALLLPAPFWFLMFLAALAFVAEPDGSPNAGAVGVMVLMLVCLPLMLLLGDQWLRRGFRLRRDARRGEVLRFERVTAAGTPEPGGERTPGPGWFEVLPATQLVWRTASGLSPEQETVQFVDVAEFPASAATAAQWTEPLDPVQAPGVEVNQRELSAAEQAELLRHLGRAAWLPLRSAIPLTLWAGGLLYTMADNYRLPHGHALPAFLLLLFATALADLLAIAGVLTAWKLRRDRHTGRVIIIRYPLSGRSPTGPLSQPTEFLPVSRRIWTVGGEPASWRLK